MPEDIIFVRSHVARDFLQNAALFKTDKLVVWEYVSNSLQYVDPGVTPVVRVTLDTKRKEITIADNGFGMDRTGLRNFFIMHGENLERRAGRAGRGRFGTGKSAAFGIADHMRVVSVRDGRRNTLELRRSEIEGAGEHAVPVRTIENDIPTDEDNGTTVLISRIRLRKLDQAGIIRYIERHLARWPQKALVLVNNHECEFTEPPVARVSKARPNDAEAVRLGDVELTIKVAKAPLDSELQGISIFTKGTWLETTLAGAQGQSMSQYIFGEIDVPALDEEEGPVPAFDLSRSMQLNQNNEAVQILLGFIGREVDIVRRELVRQDKARRSLEEARRLEREADRIAEMINNDFQESQDRVARVKARSGTAMDFGPSPRPTGNEEEPLAIGGRIKATNEGIQGGEGHGSGQQGDGKTPPNLGPILRSDEDGRPIATTRGGREEGKRARGRGGFRVEFREMGAAAPRATYRSQDRTIYVNLEHPQLVAAKGVGGIEDPTFRRLAYEVAFAEYAISLASELAANNEYIEPSDPIFDIRETLNRMARRAAALYAR